MTKMQHGLEFEHFLKLTKNQQDYIKIKAATGKPDKEISKEINVSVSTISRWKSKRHFSDGFVGYHTYFLQKHIPKAMKTMIDLLNAKSELVRFQAAKDVLDRTGYNPVDKQEIEHTGAVQFVDDI